jgi:hypothetical protein
MPLPMRGDGACMCVLRACMFRFACVFHATHCLGGGALAARACMVQGYGLTLRSVRLTQGLSAPIDGSACVACAGCRCAPERLRGQLTQVTAVTWVRASARRARRGGAFKNSTEHRRDLALTESHFWPSSLRVSQREKAYYARAVEGVWTAHLAKEAGPRTPARTHVDPGRVAIARVRMSSADQRLHGHVAK